MDGMTGEQAAAMGISVWLLVWMAIWSYEDGKKQSVPMWQLLLVTMVGAAVRAAQGQLLTGSTAAGIGIGGGLALFSVVSRGRLGSGDAWIGGIYGLYLGGEICLLLLMGGLTLASLYAMYLLIWKKRSRQSAIPLIPFLAVPYLVYWAGSWLPHIP